MVSITGHSRSGDEVSLFVVASSRQANYNAGCRKRSGASQRPLIRPVRSRRGRLLSVVVLLHIADATSGTEQEFLAAMADVVRLSTEGRVQIDAPFIDQSRRDLARLAVEELAVPVALTYSCYRGHDTHCGVCGACWSRRNALRAVGADDPTDYLT
jgi:hypothetical protein